MAFMDLDSKAIPLQLWQTLANAAIANPQQVKYAVANKFYKRYENDGPVKPATDEAPELDAAAEAAMWKELADLYAPGGNVKTLLKDDSRGTADVQGDPADSMARVYEVYNNQALKGRFQFVVSFGGGTVLFNRMRRACQTALQARMKRGRKPDSFCVQSWKVFGAAAGVGRSDSCVVYLADWYGASRVQAFVKDFLWPCVNDIVADQFRPYGLCRVQSGVAVWGLDYPAKAKFQNVLELDAQDVANNYTSAGGMMGMYLGRAFEMVDPGVYAKCATPPRGSTRDSERNALIGAAQTNARAVLQQLA